VNIGRSELLAVGEPSRANIAVLYIGFG